MATPSLLARRPAETSAITFALALLAARAVGVIDVDVVAALAVVIGGVPGAVTAVVEWRRR